MRCERCHKHNADIEGVLCGTCRNRANTRNHERRQQGLCTTCDNPSPDKWQCKACRAKKNATNRQRKLQRRMRAIGLTQDQLHEMNDAVMGFCIELAEIIKRRER